MLPASLKSIYRQYKADTDSVATWLATTAKANGYTDETTDSKKPAPKKKGKGKKKKPNGAAQAGSSGSKNTYVIKIKDFAPMAKHIAEIESISVPDDTATALERVIWVRKNFAERLAARMGFTDRASDIRHSFFVQVLERVRDYLKPLMKAGVFDAGQTSSAEGRESDNPFKNMFEALNVYNPSEAFLNAPDVVIPPSTPEVKYTVEEDNSVEELLFAFTSLLKDYDRLSLELKSLWMRYESGLIDLAAVSVATNTAFELARSMEDEIKDMYTKRPNGEKTNLAEFVAIYLTSMSKTRDIDIEDREEPGDPYNLKAYDLAQSCLLNTINLLGSYVKGNPDVVVISRYNGKFGWYDEELGSHGETNRDKWRQDMSAMLEMLPDLHFLTTNMGRSGVEDEMVRGLADLLDKPNDGVPIWLAWAAQTYLDVLHFLGPDCERGFHDMLQESRRVKKAMLDVPDLTSERRAVLTAAMKWDKDPMWEARKELYGPSPMNARFKFVRRNPMHCGLILHNIRAAMHKSGVKYAATTGAIMNTVQLYQALRQENLIPEDAVWEDLDSFWQMQGNSTFFVGDPPKNREGYFRNYCLSIGVSATHFVPGKRKNKKPNVNLDNRRSMKFMGWVSLNTDIRLRPSGDRPALSTEFIEKILEEGRLHEIRDGKGHIRSDLKGKANGEKAEHLKLSPAKLLEDLALVIEAEIPDLSFDYFAMHNSVWALLKELKEEYTRLIGPEFLRYIPQEDKLPLVVGYTFSTAAGQAGAGPTEKGEPNDSFLNAAAEIMRAFLARGQGRVIKEKAGTVVTAEDLQGAKFEDYDPWGMDRLKREINRMGAARGEEDQCPMQ
ncbi:Ank-repeat mbp1 [Fusarium albosuccineum]|uniref:Ank-repeat mbp1 n=1 Tax=Fusarium albosuccineum TaxID=1237068 RepID=A0A8H4LIM8_9HYPO|nr:Ank-repeat mbp1 [Fusarium albosuccineum]